MNFYISSQGVDHVETTVRESLTIQFLSTSYTSSHFMEIHENKVKLYHSTHSRLICFK